jgi:hypothetical protein
MTSTRRQIIRPQLTISNHSRDGLSELFDKLLPLKPVKRTKYIRHLVQLGLKHSKENPSGNELINAPASAPVSYLELSLAGILGEQR